MLLSAVCSASAMTASMVNWPFGSGVSWCFDECDDDLLCLESGEFGSSLIFMLLFLDACRGGAIGKVR